MACRACLNLRISRFGFVGFGGGEEGGEDGGGDVTGEEKQEEGIGEGEEGQDFAAG